MKRRSKATGRVDPAIGKLRRKFAVIIITSLVLATTVIIGAVNAFYYVSVISDVDTTLRYVSITGGKLDGAPPELRDGEEPPVPPEDGDQEDKLAPPDERTRQRFEGDLMTRETAYTTRFFFAETDGDGNITNVGTEHIAAVTGDGAKEFAERALSSGKAKGYIGVYRYLVTDNEKGGRTVFFLDASKEQRAVSSLLRNSVIVGAAAIVIMALLSIPASRRATRPLAESIENQKRFITDASHELKTPLSVISANAEVIEMTEGESEWTVSIRNQTARMGKLIGELLELSRLEEESGKKVTETFSATDAAADVAGSFRVVAEKDGRTFSVNVEDGVVLRGSEERFRRLTSILLDNAVKYTPAGGEIAISLRKAGRVILSVENTCEGIDRDKLGKLFDRFYRPDESRSRETGGFGIGLSIAERIVTEQGGRISARMKGDDRIEFAAEM